MHNSEIVPTQLLTEKPETQVNIYAKLASLPKDVSDKITNSKTNGGRSLDAVWCIRGIERFQEKKGGLTNTAIMVVFVNFKLYA